MEQRVGWRLAQDVGIAAVVAALGLLEVWLPMDSIQGEGSPVLSTVAILLVAVALTQRRVRPWVNIAAMGVWPLLGLLARGDIQVLFLGGLVPLVLLVYSVARHGRGRQRWVGALVAAGLLVFADLVVPLLRDPGELIFHWGVIVIAYLAGHGLRVSEDRAVASGARAAEVERAARERTLTAVADERARIARELHDIVAHSVSVMVVQAGAAEQAALDDPEFARRALGTIRETGTGALAEMRRLVTVLRAPETADLAPQPGVAALPALVEAARESGLRVNLAVTGHRPHLPAGLDLTAYRIVQEALTNIRRHSAADRAEVAVDFGSDALTISVRDEGPARDDAAEPGHGLLGMRERVALFGGQLEAARHGTGFAVRAVLPLEAT
ncbi:sensor histidine kinase [Intrasporangium sp.]|uniref:sensor histidine kinase n=1 Tax=Intrasporangium sp. TaxID=1925024 RepID=UPI00293B030A|nr:sensor histidine kinase [Intrasporangium sp.]MDV3223055.1 sensor histidine kinase [Intrasporangium sp.]